MHWTERANPLGKPTSKGIYGVWKWIFDKWAWRLVKTRTKTRASEERRVKFRSQKNLEKLAWGENRFKWILLSMIFTVTFTVITLETACSKWLSRSVGCSSVCAKAMMKQLISAWMSGSMPLPPYNKTEIFDECKEVVRCCISLAKDNKPKNKKNIFGE